MYIYRISQDARMLSGCLTKDYQVRYLVHDILYSEKMFKAMVLECYNQSTLYNSQNCICICENMIEKFGFKYFEPDLTCKYESVGTGIEIKGVESKC